MAMAFRPRLIPKSMASRYGSQALGLGTTVESVITSFSLAGFEVAFCLSLRRKVFGVGVEVGVAVRVEGIGNHRDGRFCRTGVGDHFVGRFWFAPPPATGRTHRNPRRFQVGAGGFPTDMGRLLDAPQRPAQPSQS